jgi:hypothetical protein
MKRTSDQFWREQEAKRLAQSPRRTLGAAWGEPERPPRNSDLTTRFSAIPLNRWADEGRLPIPPHVVRRVAAAAVAGGDLDGYSDDAIVGYARAAVEANRRAQVLRALDTDYIVPSRFELPPRNDLCGRRVAPRPSADQQDLGPRRRERVRLETYTITKQVRHLRPPHMRAIEVQKGDDCLHWHFTGAGRLARFESMSIAPDGTVRERGVRWHQGGPPVPVQQLRPRGRGRPAKFGRVMSAAERMRLMRHGTPPSIRKEQS